MWEYEWWRLYKTTNNAEQHIRGHFPYRRSLAAEQLLEEIKKGKLFGYVQCDIEVTENSKSKFDNFPPVFKNTLVSKIDRRLDEKLCRRRKIFVSTSKNVDIQLHITKWNTHYSSALVLSATGACYYKNTLFCRVHSKEMFQQLCTDSSGRKKARWRKSKLKRRRINNEASSQQLLRLSDHGPKPTHCNELPHWRKNTCVH